MMKKIASATHGPDELVFEWGIDLAAQRIYENIEGAGGHFRL